MFRANDKAKSFSNKIILFTMSKRAIKLINYFVLKEKKCQTKLHKIAAWRKQTSFVISFDEKKSYLIYLCQKDQAW